MNSPPVPPVKICVVVFKTLLPRLLLLVPDGEVRTVRTASAPSLTAAKVTVIGRVPEPLYTAVLRIYEPVLLLWPTTQKPGPKASPVIGRVFVIRTLDNSFREHVSVTFR